MRCRGIEDAARKTAAQKPVLDFAAAQFGLRSPPKRRRERNAIMTDTTFQTRVARLLDRTEIFDLVPTFLHE
jgi:hypothetical protein